MDDKYIAFLDVLELDDNTAFRGGCLVTDQETKPVEFRCTAAIRPTELQRVLYGKKLLEYVCNDLVGLPMLKALQSKPSLVLVRLPELLKIRPSIGVPVLWIETSPEGDIQRISPFAGYREGSRRGKIGAEELQQGRDHRAVHAGYQRGRGSYNKKWARPSRKIPEEKGK